MVMVSADGSSQSFGGLTAQISWFGLRVGSHPALSLHSSNEPGELLQWLCHDDSTINIVSNIIIIITMSFVKISAIIQEIKRCIAGGGKRVTTEHSCSTLILLSNRQSQSQMLSTGRIDSVAFCHYPFILFFTSSKAYPYWFLNNSY